MEGVLSWGKGRLMKGETVEQEPLLEGVVRRERERGWLEGEKES